MADVTGFNGKAGSMVEKAGALAVVGPAGMTRARDAESVDSEEPKKKSLKRGGAACSSPALVPSPLRSMSKAQGTRAHCSNDRSRSPRVDAVSCGARKVTTEYETSEVMKGLK